MKEVEDKREEEYIRDRKGGEKRKISLSQAGEASEAERCLWPGCALYNPTYTIFKTTKSC